MGTLGTRGVVSAQVPDNAMHTVWRAEKGCVPQPCEAVEVTGITTWCHIVGTH